MSQTNYTEYVCDRCGVVRRELDRKQPLQWHRVTKTAPVLASPLEGKPTGDWMLCRDCSEALHDFIITTEAPRG